jgi:hypothetical protein
VANGELCKKCGFQQADHEEAAERLIEVKGTVRRERPCGFWTFVSEFRHRRGCPVLDCDGDCKSTIAGLKWADEVSGHRETQVMSFVFRKGTPVPDLVFLDIGS